MKELFKALSNAQAAMKGAVKDNTNPHFKSRYADLESVIEAIKAPFAANGLSFFQRVAYSEGVHVLITTIAHEKGESFECPVPLIIAKNDMQGVGSAITYARRYGLAAAAGVSQTDDDANLACEAPRAVQSPVAKAWSSVGNDHKPLPQESPKPVPVAAKPAPIQAAVPVSDGLPPVPGNKYADTGHSRAYATAIAKTKGFSEEKFPGYKDTMLRAHRQAIGMPIAKAKECIEGLIDIAMMPSPQKQDDDVPFK